MPKPAIVVVSSHVARGSVGGRASVFALERLGFPVWSVPTVVLPWHPGHGKATRLSLDRGGFAGVVADLADAHWLGEVGAVLVGYLGDAEQVEPVARLVAAVRARNPSVLFLCDPVIGDHAGLFQPTELATAIRDRLLPLADIATPNRHELAWLVDTRFEDNAALVKAARSLGPEEVVITSAFAPPRQIGTLGVTPEGVHLATHHALPKAPNGTGDLFAALYLSHRLNGTQPPDAMRRACGSVLRLIEIAADLRVDELPLAEGQDAFWDAPAGVTLSHIERSPDDRHAR